MITDKMCQDWLDKNRLGAVLQFHISSSDSLEYIEYKGNQMRDCIYVLKLELHGLEITNYTTDRATGDTTILPSGSLGLPLKPATVPYFPGFEQELQPEFMTQLKCNCEITNLMTYGCKCGCKESKA